MTARALQALLSACVALLVGARAVSSAIVKELEDPDEITTRVYSLPAKFPVSRPKANQLKDFFVERGIEFPEGCTVAFDDESGSLVVTHRNGVQEKVRKLLESLNLLPSQVSIQVQMIRIARSLASGLFAQEAGPANVLVVQDSTLKELRTLVKSRKAIVICQPQVATVSGNTAQVKSIEEVRYLVDFEGHSTYTNMPGAISLTPAASTGFETREVGTLLNVTPTVGPDGRTISLTLVPEYTTVSRPYRKIDIPLGKTGRGVTVDSPDFTSLQVTTSVQIQSGNTLLLAVLEPTPNEPKELRDSVVLVLLTARYGAD